MYVAWYPRRWCDWCVHRKWEQGINLLLLIKLVNNKIWWEVVKMLLVRVCSIRFETKKIWMKDCYNFKVIGSLSIYLLWFLGPKYPNTSRPKFIKSLIPKWVDSSYKQLHNDNISIFWPRKLYMKTSYSSKSLRIFQFFMYDILVQIDLIPRNHT